MFDARRFLLIVGGLFVLFGAGFLFLPQAAMGFVDVTLPTTTAVMEIQGFYGGQMIGVGALMLLAALRPTLTTAGLLVVIASVGGTAAGRFVGVTMTGEFPLRMIGLFVVEVATAAFAALLLLRPQSPPPQA